MVVSFLHSSKNCDATDPGFQKDENLERTSCEHQMCAVTSRIE
jgi:hypothetical protein